MTPSRSVSSLVVGAAVLAVAACDGVVVNRSELGSTYSGALYAQSQAASGTNSLMVRNSPFPPDAVLTAVRERYQGGQFRFGLGPAPQDWNGYTVVLAFGGAPVGNQNLCQNPNLPLPLATGHTTVIADYCYGNLLVTEASGWTSTISGPDDPRFKNLVGSVVAELFSYRFPNDPAGGGQSPPH